MTTEWFSHTQDPKRTFINIGISCEWSDRVLSSRYRCPARIKPKNGCIGQFFGIRLGTESAGKTFHVVGDDVPVRFRAQLRRLAGPEFGGPGKNAVRMPWEAALARS